MCLIMVSTEIPVKRMTIIGYLLYFQACTLLISEVQRNHLGKTENQPTRDTSRKEYALVFLCLCICVQERSRETGHMYNKSPVS